MSKSQNENTPHRSEDDEPLLDHEYDGIQEADNPLPRWWVNLFWVTIIFSIVYVPVAHIGDFLPEGELQRSIAHAKVVAENREAELIASGAFDQDPVAAGKKYFGIFCVTCHGTHAEGGIGPNLTDNYWIHGPLEQNISATITNGVSAKGMPTWGPILGDRKVKMIAAYVMTLWEKPPPVAGKKAEGDPFDMATIRKPVPSDSTAAAPASTDSTVLKKKV